MSDLFHQTTITVTPAPVQKGKKKRSSLTTYRRNKFINDWLAGTSINAIAWKHGYSSQSVVRRVIRRHLLSNPPPVRQKNMSDESYSAKVEAWSERVIPSTVHDNTKHLNEYIKFRDSILNPNVKPDVNTVEQVSHVFEKSKSNSGFFRNILKILGIK